MSAELYGQWMGTPMDPAEIDDLLSSMGWGVLSLAEGGEPYSLPISFGYDGEEVCFAFIRDSRTNRKFEFIGDGSRARLLVTDVAGRFDWRSVAVTGSVRSVPREAEAWEALVGVLEDNAWFSPEFERAGGIEELRGWRLVPDEVQGLEITPDRE